MAVARVSGSAAPAVLVALVVACAAAIVAVAGGTACDGVMCGMGTCTESPGSFPAYRCDCDPGWSQLFKIFPNMPCTIPTCPSGRSCFNLTLTVPKGIPITDPCVAVDCGSEGTCVKEEGLHFHCECNPGAVNMLGVPSFPCITNCVIGKNGCPVPPSPPPPPPSPAPPGNHDSSGPPTAPSSTKGNATSLGSVSLQNLLLVVVVLLASLAAVQIV